ncbi:MAG: hypothetical protein E6J90_05830 [Deltaproteobacteria bacterium]|nr:MAG: hypothetical protein E6J90_05830 [Deltaproteobacteria bacterium]
MVGIADARQLEASAARCARCARPGASRAGASGCAARIEWTLDWDIDRIRGALCARRGDGTVACWGERDDLGAGQHSTRTAPMAVANLVMGPPRRR